MIRNKKVIRLYVFTIMMIWIALSISKPLHANESNLRHNNRIVGGVIASEDEWPWIAALLKNNIQDCGAALIHSHWVITAAHCLEDKTANYKVLLETYDLATDYQDNKYKIKEIIIHPEYNSDTIDNDIALLELTTDITWIPPLCIYQGSLADKTGIALGWGSMNSEQPNGSAPANYPDQLRQVEIPVVSQKICEEHTTFSVTDNMFCGGYAEGGKDACWGDSGGPFVINENYRWFLAGIISWGEACAWPGYYGYYTRVSNYYSFITSYVPLNQCSSDIDQNGRLELKDVLMLIKHLSNENPNLSFSKGKHEQRQ